MPDRNNEDRARLGEQTSRRNNRSMESEAMSAGPNQVENEEDLTAGDEGIDDATEFSGRGGQKGGSPRQEREGTGYTNDRSGQLQEDDSLSGSQGRHGTTGNRQGSKRGRSGTSDSERVGGETAQNPRGKDRDIDRSNM